MELAEVFTDPCGVEAWRLGEAELVAVTGAVGARIGELEALRVRLVAEVESRGTAKALGAGSTAAWVSRMSPGARCRCRPATTPTCP